jgi:predicted deacetylase
MRMLSLLALVALAGVGCGPSAGSSAAYESEDVARVELERRWLLTDDGLASDRDVLRGRVELPASYGPASVSVDGAEGAIVDGGFVLPLDGVAPGEHQLVVQDEDGRVLGRAPFTLSAPLYVVVSTDWDDTRMSDAFLERMERLRERHPGVRVTQFFAPYHYTDPAITETRRQAIDAWIKKQRDSYGDEIGVHVHGWCHFIDAKTDVHCNTADSFYVDDGSGYTTILAAYSVAEMTEILQASVASFEQNGLGTPQSFRAGGWTADAGTLRALVNAGFTVDSSAVPAHWLSTWKGYQLYDWTMHNWEGITETSQP